MSLFRPEKTSITFLLVIIPVMVLITILLIVIDEYSTYKTGHHDLEIKLDLLSQEYSDILAIPLWNVDDKRIQQILDAIQSDKDVAGIAVFDDTLSNFGSSGFLTGLPHEEVSELVSEAEQVDHINFFHFLNHLWHSIGSTSDVHGFVAHRSELFFHTDTGPEGIGYLFIVLSEENVTKRYIYILHDEAVHGLIITVLLVLVVMTIYTITTSIPLNRLHNVIRSIQEGKKEVRVDWQSNNEIGQAISAFNDLQEQQFQYQKELSDARDNLEDHVIERTKELLQSEEKFRASFEESNIGMCMVDAEGKFKRVNRLLSEMFGYSQDELREKAFSDITHPDDIEIGLSLFKKMISGELSSISFTKRYVRKDGDTIFCNVSASTVRDSDNELQFIIAQLLDITEHRKAEDALKEREYWLSESQKAASIGTYDFDIASGKWTCTSVLDHIFGIDENYDKSVEGWVNIIHPEHKQMMNEYLTYIISNVESFDKEYKILRASDGQVRWVYGRGKLILEDNVPVRMIGTIQDITERKEASLIIETALKEKKVLLREVHHRVKNNMAVISSLLALQSGFVDDKKYLDMFQESQSRIRSMALVHEKLYQSEDLSSINVNDYVRSLAENIRASFHTGRSAVKLSINVDELDLDIDTLIPCGLIINELLVNSLKHAFDGIDSPEITVTMTRREDRNISLSISDNGTGLPDGYDISRPASLGLKIIKPLAEQIDATMEVNVENGTEFRFIFPEKQETGTAD